MTISKLTAMLVEEEFPDGALEWLFTPHPLMGGKCPVDCTDDEVRNMLNRIKYGSVA